MSKSKIYTRTGDKGETSLYTGQRVPKSDPTIEAIGAVDECNCSIGVAVSLMHNEQALAQLKEQLATIQHALFDVGAALATPRTRAASSKLEKTRFDKEATAQLESWIDAMDEKLPSLHAFILPGGHPCGAALHLARSTCRRAERWIIPLYQKGEVSESVLTYLNRLSDYLFVASRYINHIMVCPEITWEQHKMGKMIV